MKVYGHPMSTCTRKVLTTLIEKNQPYDFVTVDLSKGEQKQPEHLARQPFGVVPAIDDDGFKMYESRAIIRYLDKRFPEPALSPKDLHDYGRMEQWISVEHSYFTPGAMKIIMQNIFAKMRGQEPNAGIVDQGRSEVSRTLDVVEKTLAGQEYLAGKSFSLAEISWAPYVEYLFAAGTGDLVTSRPNVSAWWGRVSGRASWKKVAGK